MGKRVRVSVVSGPLAPFAAGYESWLSSRSYSPSAAEDRLCQLGQLSRWLEHERLISRTCAPRSSPRSRPTAKS